MAVAQIKCKTTNIKGGTDMKKTLIIATILILAAALAAPVFAHGRYWGRHAHQRGDWNSGPGYCWQDERGYASLTGEQRDQLEKLHQEFRDQNIQLRNEIRSKAAELNSVLNTANPDAEKAKALQQEISNLRAKMDRNRLDFELEAHKIAPDARFGRGYGKGYGPGMGYGRSKGSYGPGGCWN
jgi:Spy/CpxP family protein refolding chaperone